MRRLCQHETGTCYHDRVIRPTWTPTTDEERAALDAVDKAVTAARKADAAMWNAVREARALDIPAQLLADRAGIGRATLYRHLNDSASQEGGAS